jgi:hypothetical protein
MISSFLGSYKSIVKHNGYILEDIWYIQQPTKDIAFQAINIYHRRHDTICTYKKHSMYLSGSQVRRERTDRHAPSTKERSSMEEEKERGHRQSIIRKRDFQMRGRRYHWMR